MSSCCTQSRHPDAPRVRRGPIGRVVVRIMIVVLHGYRLVLLPWLGHACRFQPTCSAYAIEALERHGPLRGTWLTLLRLARCNPWGGTGHDPVPPLCEGKTLE